MKRIEEDIGNLATHLDVPDINNFRENVVGYIAGGVAHYLTKKIKCEICVSHLLSSDRFDFHKLILLRDKGGLSFSSIDTFKICCTCEIVIKKIVKEGVIITSDAQTNYVQSQILKRFIGVEHIFEGLVNEHSIYGKEHHLCLIKAVIQMYINIRFHHIAKQEMMSSETKRQYYKKLTQHKGV